MTFAVLRDVNVVHPVLRARPAPDWPPAADRRGDRAGGALYAARIAARLRVGLFRFGERRQRGGAHLVQVLRVAGDARLLVHPVEPLAVVVAMLVVAVVLVEPLEVGPPRLQRPTRGHRPQVVAIGEVLLVDLRLRHQPHRLFDHGFGVEGGEDLRHLRVQLERRAREHGVDVGDDALDGVRRGLPLRLTATSITRSF